ncbi:helicase-related protein [Magnetospirillum sulfuroxidans]|uniref:Disulfide oxidoreductase n=1 Tax=Magnetospirillum sulfuroxidans TaxID=611300 RepID=A0ABS5IDZ4_9PROT|nr:helicase-related protein [Magnetospirillum sulfuroxidans]MBR9972387.1 disulfide oxidoreductase [Magnetospirillum sulfuroxidans]
MAGRIMAVLGPTNTGKTHFALDRMLGHASGMIGFPLRLLARENYDRIVKLKGAAQVALITGEEKIIPAHPRWFVCTVESMPLDRRVAFLAIDEIQLCADPERGHIFTDRLLHARGLEETVFLGAETIKPLLRRLVPDVAFSTRPRLSSLTYSGAKKLNRLPPRSAVVAFSAAEVYAMAEYVRRQRGGAAVVLGALSPRTRNAQVGLYQAGEVDYIVATDAIGMGLNMDVDHVAFAGLRKFDGRAPRRLDATEIAQIGGRAGRHMNDGTFGTTADVTGIDPDVVEAVENHVFQPLTALSWRNSALRFATTAALLASLERAPEQQGLIRAREADDHLALTILAADDDIKRLTTHPERVKLLWEICQIPDFRKVMADNHTRLLGQIFRHLCGPGRRLPTDWLANHVNRLDRADGEMDTLLARIAHVRTWTYVSHRGDWIADPSHWQERTRAIEDKLSDALHHSLTQRFVDRRTSALVRAMRDDNGLVGAVAKTGEVVVEGQFVGHLDGFNFVADAAEGAAAAKTVLAAAARSLKPEIAGRVARLIAADDTAFAVDDHGRVLWEGQPVARLSPGHTAFAPQLEMLPSDLVEPGQRERLLKRLGLFLAGALAPLFAPLLHPPADLGGPGRGLLHQLAEGLGSLSRAQAEGQITALSDQDRKTLARMDIRFGLESLYAPALLKPAAQRMRALLWSVQSGHPLASLPRGQASLSIGALSRPYLTAIGYRCLGELAVRVDILERVTAQLRGLARAHPHGFMLPPSILSTLAAKPAHVSSALQNLGWRQGETGWLAPRRQKPPAPRPPKTPDSSPFAVLRQHSAAKH